MRELVGQGAGLGGDVAEGVVLVVGDDGPGGVGVFGDVAVGVLGGDIGRIGRR